MNRVSPEVVASDPASVAQRLIGCRLARVLASGERLAGVIVETEAYLGVPDRGAHTYGGRRTARVESMYGPPGLSYVYFTYGMHHCFCIVCGEIDEPVAVLVRALIPTEGIDQMMARRPGATRLSQLCSGPGKLCQAMDIDRSLDGVDLLSDSRLGLEPPAPQWRSVKLGNSARIGLGDVGPWARRGLRWFVPGCDCVSLHRKGRMNRTKKSS